MVCSGRSLLEGFRIQRFWFDSGYMLLPVYGGFIRISYFRRGLLGSCVRFSSCSPPVLCLPRRVQEIGSLPCSYRQRQLCALAGFAGVDALRAMFPSFPLRPRCSASWPVCFPVVVNNRCLGFYSAGKLWRSRSCRSSQVLVPCRCPEADSHGLPARKTMATPQLQYFSGGRCPCCAGRVPCPCWAFSTTGSWTR